MNWPSHGGQPQQIEQLVGKNKESIIDFSANIYHAGPEKLIHKAVQRALRDIHRYPDPTYHATNQTLAEHLNRSEDEVMVTNGGIEAIYLAASLFQRGEVLLIEPTFSEYERACEHYSVGVKKLQYQLNETFTLPLADILPLLPEVDALFLCRPNNPSGTMLKKSFMKRLLQECKNTKVTLVVDEAFIDFTEDEEALDDLFNEDERAPLILLRSMTKMYSIPGLRLGYLISNAEVVKSLRDMQMPWSVNGFALNLLPLLLNEKEYTTFVKKETQLERMKVTEELRKLGYFVTDSSANFFLLKGIESGKKDDLFLYLYEHGILARHTHTFPHLNGDYLRFSVRTSSENARLVECLGRWRNRK